MQKKADEANTTRAPSLPLSVRPDDLPGAALTLRCCQSKNDAPKNRAADAAVVVLLLLQGVSLLLALLSETQAES